MRPHARVLALPLGSFLASGRPARPFPKANAPRRTGHTRCSESRTNFPRFARGGFECGFIPEPSRPAAQRLSFPQEPRGNHRLCGVRLSGGASVPHQEWPVPSQRHHRAAWRAGNDVWTVTECSLENPGLTAAAGHAGVGGLRPGFPAGQFSSGWGGWHAPSLGHRVVWGQRMGTRQAIKVRYFTPPPDLSTLLYLICDEIVEKGYLM